MTPVWGLLFHLLILKSTFSTSILPTTHPKTSFFIEKSHLKIKFSFFSGYEKEHL